MKTNLIYFVHGTTYDNANKKCSGQKQIKMIGEKLAIGNQVGNIILIKLKISIIKKVIQYWRKYDKNNCI